ncbi:MAG TPA: hypothetical protein VFM09_06015 [Marmoricola sp.]|nr:hypothetical protein [Marmoricola sp.]
MGESARAVLRQLATGRWRVVEDVPVVAAGWGEHGHVVVGPAGAFLVTTCPDRVAAVVRREVLAHFAGRGRTAAASLATDLDTVSGLLSGNVAGRLVPVVCCEGEDDLVEQLGTVKVCTATSLARALEGRSDPSAVREPTARPDVLHGLLAPRVLAPRVPGQRPA